MIDREKIIKRLASLGYEAIEEDDFLIGFLIESTYQTILNQTNQESIPDELENIAVDMVCGKLLHGKLSMNKIDIEKAVASIREGDTSISYVNTSDPQAFLNDFYKNMMLPIRDLIKFRKLVW